MKIKEVIVVEGHHDSATLKQYFDVDTIETNGSAIDEKTLDYIKAVSEKRGIIVFTDPDYAGERIRRIVNQRVDGAKNAFIERDKALGKNKVGVEHATKADLEDALNNLVTFNTKNATQISKADLCILGLDGMVGANKRRERLANVLKIGKCNAKTFLNRLNLMGISHEELSKLCEELDYNE